MNHLLKLDLEQRYRGRRILVADDDRVNLVVTATLLRAAGMHVTPAADGREAVACAAAERPHLILMDLHMPHLDGRAATAWLRGRLGLRIPIIAMTATTDAEELSACLAAGMDDILAKPAEPNAIYACLSQWLSAPEAR